METPHASAVPSSTSLRGEIRRRPRVLATSIAALLAGATLWTTPVLAGGGAGGTFAGAGGAQGQPGQNDINGVGGGAAGTSGSPNGGNGAGLGNGSGGGGGGYSATLSSFSNPITLVGGNGGAGGNAAGNGNGGGGGGEGGYGLILTGAGPYSITIGGSLQGGTGGTGGMGEQPPNPTANGGGGGSGGIGLQITQTGVTVQNAGTITGGNGGAGGVGGAGSGANGAGGAGVSGGGLTLINSGTITGGLSGDGVTRASAIVNTGSAGTFDNQNGGVIIGDVSLGNFANAVTLETGSTITGALNIGTSTSATLTLTGSGTQTYSTAVTGTTTFSGALTKTGAGTWTLDEIFTFTGGTTVNAGTLQLGDGTDTAALIAGSGLTAVTVNNTATLSVLAHASIIGGTGGTGSDGGAFTGDKGGNGDDGGAGVNFTNGGSPANSGSITGGTGGAGGTGGLGNSGPIGATGGAGGVGGAGGAGVNFTNGGSPANSGSITGGTGGAGGTGGQGGPGNPGGPGGFGGIGGPGGPGGTGGVGGQGGTGGAGVNFSSGGSITNSGSITGGTGGAGGNGGQGGEGGPGDPMTPGAPGGTGGNGGVGGAGGTGVNFSSGGSLTNSGSITGGAGGAGGNGGSGGVGGFGMFAGPNGPGGAGGAGGAGGTGVTFSGAAGTLDNQNGGIINGGVSMGNFANAVTLQIGSAVNGALNIGTSTSATLTLTDDGTGGTQTFSAAVTGTTTFSGALTKAGTGTWTLDQAFTYSGSTTVQDGTLKLGVTNALPTGTAVTINQTDGSGNAILDLNGHNQTIAGLTIIAPLPLIPGGSSIVDVNGGVLTLAGNVNVVDNGTVYAGDGFISYIQDTAGGGALDLGGATRTFTIAGQNNSTQDLRINAVIQGTGGVVINASPSTFDSSEGGVVFGAANTYTGSTTVAQGRLTTTVAGALPSTTDLVLGTASSALTGDVDLNGTNQTVNSLSLAAGNSGGAGNYITSNSGASTLTVSSTTTSSTFGGLITGPLLLVKAGAGTTLTLTAANTYTGTTTVSGGTLLVNNTSGSGTGSNTVAVSVGATLGGSGTIGGGITLNGTIAPGAGSPGVAGTTLHAASLAWNGGGALTLQLGATGDQLALSGALTKLTTTVGPYTINILNAGIAQQAYTLATFASIDPGLTAGTFTLALPSGYSGALLETSTSLDLVLAFAATGSTIENAAPVSTPLFADFTVTGPVHTGGPADNNTIKSLIFTPGGTLTIFNTLTLTSGNVTTTGGTNSIMGGTLYGPNGLHFDVNGNLFIDSTLIGNAVKTGTGSLFLDGALFGNLSVLEGLLGGNGTIFGNLFNASIVSPGHSPGHINVGGNYTQTPNALLKIEIGGSDLAQHDLLSVGGTASLNGTLQLVRLNNFNLKRHESVAFLTANAGVNGKFANVVSDFNNNNTILQPTVIYGSNSVSLEAVQGSFAALAGLTPNEQAVARALDHATGDHRTNALFDYLDYRTLNKLPGDLDRIAPEELTSIFTLGVSLDNVQSLNIQRRTDDIRSGSNGFSAAGLAINGGGPSYSGGFGIDTGVAGPNGSAVPSGDDGKEVKETKTVVPAENRWGVFLSGTGEWVSVGNTDNARGYNLESGGFTLGVDYKVTPNLAIGLAAGYTGTTADLTDGGRIYVNGGKIGLYGTFFQNEQPPAPTMSKDSSKEAPAPAPSIAKGFYADVAVFGGYNSYDIHRSALQGEARSDADGGELNVLFGTGYDFKAGGLTYGPTASFNYTYVGLNSFTEHGSLAPLNVHGSNEESLRSAFGIKASYDWKVGGLVIKPELRAAWQHEYGDTAYALNSSFANGAGGIFTVHGPQLGRDSALLGAGFAIELNDRAAIYAYYDGELGRTNYQSTSVTGGFRLAF